MSEAAATQRRGIFGCPISYIALMAAVVAVLQLIPFSVVLGPGVSFPLSLAVTPLVGILLGPWAGALAVLIGSAIGVMIAPHTAWLGPITPLIMVAAPLASGLITTSRRYIVGAYFILATIVWLVLFLATNGFPTEHPTAILQPWRYLVPGILLFLPKINGKAVRFLQSERRLALGVGLAYLIWIGSQADHTLSSIIGNLILFQLPEEVWSFLTLYIIGAERGALALVGTVIGIGVILGLRHMGLAKPRDGVW